MIRVRSFTLLTLVLLMAFSASAHDTWLLARRPVVVPGARATFDLTSGMTFPTLDFAIKPERVNTARCRLNGKNFEIAELSETAKSLVFQVRLQDGGIAVIWVELKPRLLELTPKQVEEYLDEINAPDALRQSWKHAEQTKKWREIYTKHAKTFVKVGEAITDHSWSEPVGMAFEIVPEKNPTTLRAGDDFPVRVLKNGSPLPDFSLGIVREGNTLIKFQKTDAEGRVSFRLARSGKWLLRGTELRPSNKPDTEWESDFTTLTIEVK